MFLLSIASFYCLKHSFQSARLVFSLLCCIKEKEKSSRACLRVKWSFGKPRRCCITLTAAGQWGHLPYVVPTLRLSNLCWTVVIPRSLSSGKETSCCPYGRKISLKLKITCPKDDGLASSTSIAIGLVDTGPNAWSTTMVGWKWNFHNEYWEDAKAAWCLAQLFWRITPCAVWGQRWCEACLPQVQGERDNEGGELLNYVRPWLSLGNQSSCCSHGDHPGLHILSQSCLT